MKEKKLYLVALPENYKDIDIPEYKKMKKIGTTYAPTDTVAVGNFLRRNIENKAGIIQQIIRDNLGGYEEFALEIVKDEEYFYEDGSQIPPEELLSVREIEITQFLQNVYFNQNKDQSYWLNKARKIIDNEIINRINKKTGLEKRVA